MSNEFMNEEAVITLTLEDDSTMECVVLAIYPAGDHEYIALLPVDSDEDEGEVLVYRYAEKEDGEVELTNIETDEEYEIAADAFDEILDEMEFDEMDE